MLVSGSIFWRINAMSRARLAGAKSCAHEDLTAPHNQNRRVVGRVESLCVEALATVPPARVEEVARQWLAKAKFDPVDAASSDQSVVTALALALASRLLLFSPSLLGAAPVERFVRRHRAEASPEARQALDALANANFRLLRLRRRVSSAEFLAEDLAGDATLTVFDAAIPDGAVGAPLGAWLAPPCPMGVS